MDIKPLTPSDYPVLIQIWEASVRATHDFLLESDIPALRQAILDQYFDAVELWGVTEHDKVIGFLGLHDGNIEMLFISPDFRGKGVGKKLTRFAIAEKAATKVDVNEQNPQALGFYERMGFTVVRRSPLDGQGKPYPLLHMALDVGR